MNKRKIAWKAAALFLLAASVLSYSSCGGTEQGLSGDTASRSASGETDSTESVSENSSAGLADESEEDGSLKNADTGTVVVYSPHDADPLNADIVAFMKAYPSIKVVLVAGGTVELCDKIVSQGDAPEADVLWGGGADTLAAYEACFEEYSSCNSSAIDAGFIDKNGKWTGESPLPMVLIYNKKLLRAAGIAEPSSWADLLNPALKGQIAYCQPSKSGSAYTQLCTMILANGGGDAGWDYVRKLVANLNGRMLDSSGKCHKLVASGEFMVGITIEKSAMLYKGNENIGYCYPSEGTSAVPDAIAVVKNCPHEENAKLFTDFILSHDAQEEQSTDWKRRPSRNDVSLPEGLVSMSEIKLVDYDFTWAANDKEKIISRFNML